MNILKRPSIIIAIVVLLLTFIVVIALVTSCSNQNLDTTNSVISNPLNELKITPITTKLKRKYVLENKSTNDCVFIYKNNVYKIPNQYFTLHPGGSEYLAEACGYDITNYFDLTHSPNAKKIMDQFYYAQLED